MGVGIPWKPISEKPEGESRKVLVWFPSTPKIEGRPQLVWWLPMEGHFFWTENSAWGIVKDATHWAEITKPSEPSLEKVYQEAIEHLSFRLNMYINKNKQMGETEVALMARIFELEQKIAKLEKKNDQSA